MPHHHSAAHEAPQSTAGLLLSLSYTLERSDPLARAARRMAHRLSRAGRPSRDLALQAADMLARLLDASDDMDGAGDDAQLLDARFDD